MKHYYYVDYIFFYMKFFYRKINYFIHNLTININIIYYILHTTNFTTNFY